MIQPTQMLGPPGARTFEKQRDLVARGFAFISQSKSVQRAARSLFRTRLRIRHHNDSDFFHGNEGLEFLLPALWRENQQPN